MTKFNAFVKSEYHRHKGPFQVRVIQKRRKVEEAPIADLTTALSQSTNVYHSRSVVD